MTGSTPLHTPTPPRWPGIMLHLPWLLTNSWCLAWQIAAGCSWSATPPPLCQVNWHRGVWEIWATWTQSLKWSLVLLSVALRIQQQLVARSILLKQKVMTHNEGYGILAKIRLSGYTVIIVVFTQCYSSQFYRKSVLQTGNMIIEFKITHTHPHTSYHF